MRRGLLSLTVCASFSHFIAVCVCVAHVCHLVAVSNYARTRTYLHCTHFSRGRRRCRTNYNSQKWYAPTATIKTNIHTHTQALHGKTITNGILLAFLRECSAMCVRELSSTFDLSLSLCETNNKHDRHFLVFYFFLIFIGIKFRFFFVLSFALCVCVARAFRLHVRTQFIFFADAVLACASQKCINRQIVALSVLLFFQHRGKHMSSWHISDRRFILLNS